MAGAPPSYGTPEQWEAYGIFLASLKGSADWAPRYDGEWTGLHSHLIEGMKTILPSFSAFVESLSVESIQKLADDLLRNIDPTIHHLLLGELSTAIVKALADKDVEAAIALYEEIEDWLGTIPYHEETLQALVISLAKESPEHAVSLFVQKAPAIRRGWKGDVAFGELVAACVPHGAARMRPLFLPLAIERECPEFIDHHYPEEDLLEAARHPSQS